jgi:WXG100 family type VII secretion target
MEVPMAEVSKIKVEYARMDEMAKTFQQGSEQLKDTLAQMQSIANTLQDGALLGQGGAAFVDAIRNKLCPSISRLEQKFLELQRDVQGAKRDMEQADSTSKGLMG